METPVTTSGLDGTPGRPGVHQRSRSQQIWAILCKHWLYIGKMVLLRGSGISGAHRASGIAIVLATINLLLGIVSLSYMSPKKDGVWTL